MRAIETSWVSASRRPSRSIRIPVRASSRHREGGHSIMSQELFDVLKRRCEPAEMRKHLGTSARDLDARVLQLTASLNGTASLYDGQGDSPEGKAVFAYVAARCNECGVEAQRRSQP